jgi:hypothetical protein
MPPDLHGLSRRRVPVMEANGLTKFASNDADFGRVPGLARYAPA